MVFNTTIAIVLNYHLDAVIALAQVFIFSMSFGLECRLKFS